MVLMPKAASRAPGKRIRFRPVLMAGAGLLALALSWVGAWAQEIAIPNFWDPRASADKPDLTGFRPIRFLIDDDFPPLYFAGPDGNPTGFSVELARAACERLALTCTIQVRRFDTLLDALADRQGDVVAAAFPISAALRERFCGHDALFQDPGPLRARRDRAARARRADVLRGQADRCRGGDGARGLRTCFHAGRESAVVRRSGDPQAALKTGDIDYAVRRRPRLRPSGSAARNPTIAARSSGGPYLESRYFGEGIGFIVRHDDETLRRAFDFALQQLWKEGKYAELYLRFFPVSPF